MRLFKTFGLAALAAVAAMAFAGVGTAAATTTVICTVNQTPCEPGNILTQGEKPNGGTLIKAVNQGVPILKVYEDEAQTTIENEIECNSSTVEGRYQEKGTQEEPQHRGEITKLSFTGCDIGGVPFSECRSPGQASGIILGAQLPYQTLLSQTENQNGKLKIFEQPPNGQPGAEIICKAFGFTVLNCTFKVAETDGEQVGGTQNVGIMQVTGATATERAKISANQLELKWEGPNCPSGVQKAKWDSQYEVTEPNNGNLWVSQQEP